MARPDVQIGERVFSPKEMGVVDRVKTGLLYTVSSVASGLLNSIPSLHQVDCDRLRLGAFYGSQAVTVFEDAVRPKVRAVRPKVRSDGPQPVVDPYTRKYRYRFFGTPSGSQTLVVMTR